MGSGLILLLIVGAWLAVLVPMALRSHEASALGTVDKFSDAMRVLSRRESVGRAVVPADEPVLGEQDEPAPARGRLGRLRAGLARLLHPRALRRRGGAGRRPLTPAARRRRALLGLVAVAALTLVGPLVGPLWLLAPHLLADVLLVVFVCWLRASAVARAEREWRIAMGGRSTAAADLGPILPVEDEQPAPVRVAGVPDRLPTRDELDPLLDRQVPAPREEDLPARGAHGQPWQPVPLPVPTYVTAPVVPRRPARALSGATALATAQGSASGNAYGAGLEHVLGQRRAVGD